MTTTVINLRHETCDVRIDRRSKWGNPFKIGPGLSREEAVKLYRPYILSRPDLLADLPELRGKRLGCWCANLPCHGDVLLELLEATP